MQKQDIMIDLETMGTRADSVILSIGAVRFDGNEIDNDGFYSSISIDSNHERGVRNMSESTLNWWMTQSPEAQKVFTEEKTTLGSALMDLADWIDGYSNPNVRVWGNGADFDIAMLAHAYGTFDIELPWQFWNVRCFRTLKNISLVKKIPKPANMLAHNALYDAIAQAQHLQAMWKVLNQ